MRRPGSPIREFAVLSLGVIGVSTLLFGLVLGHFVERGMLDRGWVSTSALVRAAAHVHLRPGDFATASLMDRPDAAERLEEFGREVRRLPEALRLVAYRPDGSVLWADSDRAVPPHGLTPRLRDALAGAAEPHLDESAARGQERVELYVPLTFPGDSRVAGVVEVYVDASRVMASVRQARLTLWALALAAGAALWLAVFGVVRRASRTLDSQHRALAQRANELARANAELTSVQQQLLAAERLAAFGEVTAAVAHGLGNPLAAIRASAQLGLLDAPPGPVRDQLDAIVADADRLRERMRGLLRLGRPVEPTRVPTTLAEVVDRVATEVAARAGRQGVRLDLAVSPGLPKVHLDPARFEEALLCLAGNALDAMPAGGVLRITAAASGPDAAPSIVLAIEDTGPGFSEEVRARAFEPFFTTRPGGSGLGLPLARKLLEATGARLELISRAPGGRVVVTVPVLAS